MFDNVGSKLKKMAKVFCWIGIIAFVLLGFITIFAAEKQYDPGNLRITGFCYLFIGPICSWLSSLGIYALGQIAEDVEATKFALEADKKT